MSTFLKVSYFCPLAAIEASDPSGGRLMLGAPRQTQLVSILQSNTIQPPRPRFHAICQASLFALNPHPPTVHLMTAWYHSWFTVQVI